MSDIMTGNQLVGLPALEEAYAALTQAGLRTPPVPNNLLPRLRHLSGDICATASGELADRASFLVLAADAGSVDQVSFGHVGHGLLSWWFCYSLLTPSLAVFVRLAHGGLETSDDAACSAVNLVLFQTEELVVAADQSAGTTLPAGARLVVVLDDTADSFIQVGQSKPTILDDPFGAAFAHLGWLPEAAAADELDDEE